MKSKRIPYVILLAALMAIPLYYLRDEMDTEPIRKKRYWIAKSNNKKQYQVVFGGDSRVFRGISPDHFEQEFTGIKAFNFAYWSNGYGKIYLEGLENKIDKSSEFKVIVLGVSPHSLTPNGAKCAHYRSETSRSKEQKLQNLYFSKAEVTFAPYTAIELLEKISGKSKPNNYRITYHSNGWVESHWVVPDTSYSAQFYKEIFTDNMVSDEVVADIMEYVGKWTNSGIHVVGFRPPTSFAIRQMEQELGGFSEAHFVEQFEGVGGVWIPVPNDDYQTFDGNHLEHESAKRISKDLGRIIRQELYTH